MHAPTGYPFQTLIPSHSIDMCMQPVMKAREIADAGIQALKSGKYRYVRLNFANPDMVAHTGDLDAAIEACSVVDKCVKVRPQPQPSLSAM